MPIRVEAKTRQAERFLEGLVKDQLPFALSLGLNMLGNDFVQEEKRGIALRFTIRRPSFILPSVKMQRGTKASPNVLAFIDPDQSILAKFELGGRRTAAAVGSLGTGRTVLGSIAIPQYLSATDKSGVVRQSLLPSNLGLAQARRLDKKSGRTEITRAGMKGKRRTFVIAPDRSFGLPDGGIFQRVGRGRRDIRLLFVLKPSVPVPPILQFEQTGKQVAEERWKPNMDVALQRALDTALDRAGPVEA